MTQAICAIVGAGEGLGKGCAVFCLGGSSDPDGGGMEGVSSLHVVSLAGLNKQGGEFAKCFFSALQ